MSTYRYLSHTVPYWMPSPWRNYRNEAFDVSRVSWEVMVDLTGCRLLVTTVLHGVGRDGARTNATERGETNGVGSPVWPDGAPHPPAWFTAAAAAFIRDHAPDLDPEPARVSSQAGLSTIRPGGAA